MKNISSMNEAATSTVHTILLIEKHNNIPESVIHSLGRNDLNFIITGTMQEGIQACKEHSEMAMIIMPMDLAMLNGVGTVDQIRNILPEVPVIFLSNYLTIESIRLATLMECDEIIQNPVDRTTLNAVIMKHIKQSKQF
jgi:DNA-binding NtrC family response regulator